MARIRNVSSGMILIGPGSPENHNEPWLPAGVQLVMQPNAGANPDLDKILFNDDLAQSRGLAALIGDGAVIIVNTTEEPLSGTDVEGFGGMDTVAGGLQQADINAIKAYVVSTDAVIQFFDVNGPSSDNTFSGVKEGTEVSVGVTNGVGVLDPFNNVATVEVVVVGGTATSPKINGEDGPVLLTVSGGLASAVISASDAGSVLLALQNGNTTLDRSDTATVNLS